MVQGGFAFESSRQDPSAVPIAYLGNEAIWVAQDSRGFEHCRETPIVCRREWISIPAADHAREQEDLKRECVVRNRRFEANSVITHLTSDLALERLTGDDVESLGGRVRLQCRSENEQAEDVREKVVA